MRGRLVELQFNTTPIYSVDWNNTEHMGCYTKTLSTAARTAVHDMVVTHDMSDEDGCYTNLHKKNHTKRPDRLIYWPSADL